VSFGAAFAAAGLAALAVAGVVVVVDEGSVSDPKSC
jgi:hypothetical protein